MFPRALRAGFAAAVGGAATSLLALLATAHCGGTPTAPSTAAPGTYTFDFRSGPQDWIGTPDDLGDGSRTAIFKAMPPAVGGSGFYIVGKGFVFIKRQVTGLVPSREYRVRFSTQFASAWPAQCYYTDDAPWSTFVRAGATTQEPRTRIETVSGGSFGSPTYKVVPDFDLVSTSVPLGDIGTPMSCARDIWTMKTLDLSDQVTVVADSNGAVWLYEGIDQFAGGLSIYVVVVTARFD